MTRSQRHRHLRLVHERHWPLGDQAERIAASERQRPSMRSWVVLFGLTALYAIAAWAVCR